MCIVKAGWAWPRRSLTTLMGTPAATSSDAWVWRRSWKRMRGRPARRVVVTDTVEPHLRHIGEFLVHEYSEEPLKGIPFSVKRYLIEKA